MKYSRTKNHPKNWIVREFVHTATVDKPIAALIQDLKARGLLDETLIVWIDEFGRMPDNGVRSGGKACGRDHNPKAMTVWMAGGGRRAGHTIGATDETMFWNL